jgi:hypothetical protein
MDSHLNNSKKTTSETKNGYSPDPRCRMVEHIVAQYSSSENYVRNVMNETKVGATRQPVILNMIRNVITDY